ncbi:hypothetical protein DRH27_05985, partial [Candidatus Falkowbacteria bacterium]
IEDKSLHFSSDLALFTMPDLAITDTGKYVSMFAPGVSFLAIPGYLLGKYFGIAQVGTYLVIAIFALLNILLVRAIAIKLGAHPLAANLGGLAFAFATPAFAYATAFYQHHITVFLILLSIYILLRWSNWLALSLIWFFCALSIAVDNPNFFLLFPIGIFAFTRIINAKKDHGGILLKFKPVGILTLLIMVIPISLFLFYNQKANGDPWRLSGTLTGAKEVSANHLPVNAKNNDNPKDDEKNTEITTKNEKHAFGFFQTRNLFNGFYIYIISPDRGILWFTPIVLFGIWGLIITCRRHQKYVNLITAIIGINILVYSMWGDPYGGWAFGSRYLIPSYALLCIGLALFLTKFKKRGLVLAIFFIIFAYSSWVNTLGALTSSANPPQIEVLALEEKSGREEKYTYMRNWEYLNNAGSKSYIYRAYAGKYMTAYEYFALLAVLLWLSAGYLLTRLRFHPKNNYHEHR